MNLDEGRESIWLRRAIRKEGGKLVEAELKTHQQRRIALDAETVAVLRDHRERCQVRASSLGHELGEEAFVFSGVSDGSEFPRPDGVTQRYDRLAAPLGIVTILHKLRHYSATELIAAGVDVRTVAGRLGHAGGGTTTLRTYSAWVSEADQRAATGLGARMPERPPVLAPRARARIDPRRPYERLAVGIARRTEAGELAAGAPTPTAKEIVSQQPVGISTARRAIALLKEWGLVGPRATAHPPRGMRLGRVGDAGADADLPVGLDDGVLRRPGSRRPSRAIAAAWIAPAGSPFCSFAETAKIAFPGEAETTMRSCRSPACSSPRLRRRGVAQRGRGRLRRPGPRRWPRRPAAPGSAPWLASGTNPAPRT